VAPCVRLAAPAARPARQPRDRLPTRRGQRLGEDWEIWSRPAQNWAADRSMRFCLRHLRTLFPAMTSLALAGRRVSVAVSTGLAAHLCRGDGQEDLYFVL
jgi:hypothetical protein